MILLTTASNAPVVWLLFSIEKVPLGFCTSSVGKLLFSESTTRARAPYGARLATTAGAGCSVAPFSLVTCSEDGVSLIVRVIGAVSAPTAFSV